MRPYLRVWGVALTGCLMGCYSYVPVRVDQVSPAEAVRVTVTGQQALELESALRGIRRTFNATYVGQSQDDLLLEVSLRSEVAGMSSRGLNNRLAVPADDIVAVERRQLSKGRTAAVALAALGALTAVSIEAFSGDNKSEGEDPNPIDEIRIPIFSIPIGGR